MQVGQDIVLPSLGQWLLWRRMIAQSSLWLESVSVRKSIVSGLFVAHFFAQGFLTDSVEVQFAEYQHPGYKQDPVNVGNSGCYRLQVGHAYLFHISKWLLQVFMSW
jgi:hypothetical protein